MITAWETIVRQLEPSEAAFKASSSNKLRAEMRCTNKTGVIGVSRRGTGMYDAYGHEQGKRRNLYYGSSFTEAVKARRDWEATVICDANRFLYDKRMGTCVDA